MKFCCEKSVILENINIVLKAVSAKSSAPILEGILITASDDGSIKLLGNDLKNAISAKNYIGAKNIVENKLYGTVTHKQIRFKTNKYGKYFKYKIISVNNLDY